MVLQFRNRRTGSPHEHWPVEETCCVFTTVYLFIVVEYKNNISTEYWNHERKRNYFFNATICMIIMIDKIIWMKKWKYKIGIIVLLLFSEIHYN